MPAKSDQQSFCQRTIRVCLPALRAAAPQNAQALALGAYACLVHEARLTYPCFAQQDDGSPVPAAGLLDCSVDGGDLGLAVDEDGTQRRSGVHVV
jgi:hypothetical protein